jgi:hypothetical protein
VLWNQRNGTYLSGRLGRKSVMVGRLVAHTWNIKEILRTLEAEVPPLEALAKKVVDELNGEIERGKR